jgi:hypothetical protein
LDDSFPVTIFVVGGNFSAVVAAAPETELVVENLLPLLRTGASVVKLFSAK